MTDHPLDELEDALAEIELMLDDDAEEAIERLSDLCVADLPKREREALEEEVRLLDEELRGNQKAGH